MQVAITVMFFRASAQELCWKQTLSAHTATESYFVHCYYTETSSLDL